MWLSFFAVPAFIILCLLGSWQMQRLGWKSNLIEECSTKFSKDPLILNENFKNLSEINLGELLSKVSLTITKKFIL